MSDSRRAKGAIVTLDANTSIAASIPFQYNPNSVRRSLQPALVGGQSGAHSDTVRFAGPPTEIFNLEVELDAMDGGLPKALAQGSTGLYPMLYALEQLAYPPLNSITSQRHQLSLGVMEIAPVEASPTLLVWGGNRVVPVVLQAYSIVEQFFDGKLNPIRAVVSLTARVLTSSDINSTYSGYDHYISYQRNRESLAQQVSPLPNMQPLTQAADESPLDLAVSAIHGLLDEIMPF